MKRLLRASWDPQDMDLSHVHAVHLRGHIVVWINHGNFQLFLRSAGEHRASPCINAFTICLSLTADLCSEAV